MTIIEPFIVSFTFLVQMTQFHKVNENGFILFMYMRSYMRIKPKCVCAYCESCHYYWLPVTIIIVAICNLWKSECLLASPPHQVELFNLSHYEIVNGEFFVLQLKLKCQRPFSVVKGQGILCCALCETIERNTVAVHNAFMERSFSRLLSTLVALAISLQLVYCVWTCRTMVVSAVCVFAKYFFLHLCRCVHIHIHTCYIHGTCFFAL